MMGYRKATKPPEKLKGWPHEDVPTRKPSELDQVDADIEKLQAKRERSEAFWGDALLAAIVLAVGLLLLASLVLR